jgi:hypothetical protein
MTKISTQRLSDVARYVVAPAGICSTGWPAVRDTCSRLGWGFDGWQDGAGKLVLSKGKDGMYAADLAVVSIPRQVGKTYLFMCLVFALCLMNPGMTVIWTAHRVKTAKETFNSMSGAANQEKVRPHIAQVVRGRGDEAILFTNGSRILFGAREAGFGRGFTNVGVLVFDEAQILTESAMEDMIAAQNVAHNPLTILTGTPPRPRDPGEVFTMARQEALDGESEEVLYIELSADEDADLMDRAQWRRANPSFPSRTPERAMLRMKKNLSEDSFRREALGVWDDISVHKPIVTTARWREMADVGPANDVRPHGIGVDMSHGRDISIAGCWIEGESAHIEELMGFTDPGLAIEYIHSHAKHVIPVVIDGASPAASLVPELRTRRCQVTVTSAPNMAQACGLLENRIATDTLTHGAQPRLTDAVLGARRRPIRDAGGWALDRSDPSSQIYPAVAATLALFGATTAVKRSGTTKRKVRVMN